MTATPAEIALADHVSRVNAQPVMVRARYIAEINRLDAAGRSVDREAILAEVIAEEVWRALGLARLNRRW